MAPTVPTAQVLYGSVLGDVKDTTGASVPGANVVITNQGTGLTREAVTDTAGHYNLPDLPAGIYSLKISQQGFKTFEQNPVTVNINSVTRVDVPLEVGAMTDTVTVSAEPPKLQTDTAEVHQTLVAADLSNLPVPLGRNYQQVYRVLPGFAPPFNSHSIPTNPARSLEFTRQRDERRPEQHAHRRREHRARPAAACRFLCADARVDRRGQHRHQQHGCRTRTRRRRRDQRADEERHQRDPRIWLRIFHQPASEGLADAIRRCGVEHR